MKKYEEDHYKYENIRKSIYPVIKSRLYDAKALNGKALSEKDTVVLEFAGELKIIFAIKRSEEAYEILKDSMLPPEISPEELYQKACANLAKDVEFVIANTWYGAFGILADGIYEASALCLKHIWQICVDKLKDDLIIMVPSGDTLRFAPAGESDALKKMEEEARGAYESSSEKITMQKFLFSKTRKDLTAYE